MIQKLLTYQETDKKLKALENKINGSEEKKKSYVAQKFLLSVDELVSKLDAKAEDLLNKFTQLTEKQKDLSSRLEYISTQIEDSQDETDISYMLKIPPSKIMLDWATDIVKNGDKDYTFEELSQYIIEKTGYAGIR